MKKVTFEEYERFVRNRPCPDTLGFYKLWRLKCKNTGYICHEVKYTEDDSNKKSVGKLWRFPILPLSEMEYEYHPTFEAAFDSMNQPSQIDNKIAYCDSSVNFVIGYRICRLGFGPHGTRDFYIDYHNYDRFRNEYDRSSCSSYHWNMSGIYGKFLGRFPEQITFNNGDFVEISLSKYEDDGREYSVLGIVIGIPKTVKEVWSDICDDINNLHCEQPLETYFETPDMRGVDDEEYFILYGPYEDSLRFATFRHPIELRPPSFEVPTEAKETLTKYYDAYMQSITKELEGKHN